MLYTNLAADTSRASSANGFRGLGHVDSTKDVLSITFEVANSSGSDLRPLEQTSVKGRGRRKKGKTPTQVAQTIEIQLLQDKTSLRSRKGDTGSVVWKARYLFQTR